MIPNGSRADVVILRYIELVEGRENRLPTKSEMFEYFGESRADSGIRCLIRNKEIVSNTKPRMGVSSLYSLTPDGRINLEKYRKNNIDEMKAVDAFLETLL